MGVSITYRVQEEAGGIAQALALAEDFVNGGPVVVLLGDNIFYDHLGPFTEAFRQQKEGAKILLKQVSEPERYGIAELENGQIVSLAEKPSNPRSNYAVTGIYMYDSSVFDIIRKQKPSKRGELEITDVNREYLRRQSLTFDFLPNWWVDAGTHQSLLEANRLASTMDLQI